MVESDTTDITHQNQIIRELELPIACLVYSGGKSLHAIVRIDAQTLTNTASVLITSMMCARKTA